MRHIDDTIDMATSTLLIVFMLWCGVWALQYVKGSIATPVFEKTAPLVQVAYDVPPREYSAKDLLLGLVVNDELRPDPGIVELWYNSRSYTITYNSAWFSDKESNINKAWDEFFQYCIDAPTSVWTPNYNAAGVLQSWRIVIT